MYIRYPSVGGNGVATYTTRSAFPSTANNGTLALALDTDTLYAYNTGGATWVAIGGPSALTTIGTFSTSPVAAGLDISGSGVLTLHAADGTHAGAMSIGTQTFGGNKTFLGSISASNLSGTNTGDQTITLTSDVTGSGTGSFATTIAANAVTNAKSAQMATLTIKGNNTGGNSNPLDLSVAQVQTMLGTSGTNTGDVTLTAVGSSPSANGASLSGQILTLQPADGTHPGVLTTGTQTIGGDKTFSGAISASNFSGSSSGSNTGDQTITLTSDVTGSGTGSFATTVAAVGGSTAAAVHQSQLDTAAATNLNTASTIVKRDSSGNFVAGTVTAALTGTASGNTTITPVIHSLVISSSTNALSTLGVGGTGTMLQGNFAANPTFTPTPTLGVAGSLLGSLSMCGDVAGTFTMQAASNGSGYSIIWPAAQASGTKFLQNDGSGNLSWTSAGSGSVTSVTFTGDGTVLSSTPSSAVTTSGTLTAALATQSANKILAGPTNGSAAAPTFRSFGSSDYVVGSLNSNLLVNLGFAASVSSNILTFSLKQNDGSSAPTAAAPVLIAMRSSTATTGGYNLRSITGALTLAISNGTTLGTQNSTSQYLYLYAIDSDGAGTMKLGVSCVKRDEGSLQNTVAESSTVTISIANPAVITLNGHGFGDGNAITFTTSSSLPTGITAGTTYFVINSSTNTFNISATSGGSTITTTGSQAGTQTVHVAGSRLASDAVYANVPVRLIGRIAISESTAGTWATGATEVSIAPLNDSFPGAVGFLGEFIQSRVTSLTTMTAASAAWQDATSMVLSPGEWDVALVVDFQDQSGNQVSELNIGISTTTGNSSTGLQEGDNWIGNDYSATLSAGFDEGFTLPSYRMSLDGPTTIYGKLLGVFTSAPKYRCRLSARRIRW